MPQKPSDILKVLNENQYAPFYFLHGDEPYFIDQITDYIEQNALSKIHKSFDQVVLYGRDVKMVDIINQARRFPMMASRQVVIVKEAQSISDLKQEKAEKLLTQYLNNTVPFTILVFCHKHKALDKRKAIYKTMNAKGIVVNSDKIKDWNLSNWINSYFQQKKRKADPEAVYLFSEYIGNNLNRLSKEIDKIILANNSGVISHEIVQKQIGISKDYNVFELQKALAKGDVLKANKIVQYFATNSKEHPIFPVLSMLYSFYNKLILVNQCKDKSERGLSEVLKLPTFVIRDYLAAAQHCNLMKAMNSVEFIFESDLQAKGLQGNLSGMAILQELVFKLLH